MEPRTASPQGLWQAKTNFSQDKCTRCSPSKWPIVDALPAQYLGRGPGPLPINRASHPRERGDRLAIRLRENEGRLNPSSSSSPQPRTDPRKVVLPCIVHHQPKRQSTTPPHWSRVLHHIGGPNQYKLYVSCAVFLIA